MNKQVSKEKSAGAVNGLKLYIGLAVAFLAGSAVGVTLGVQRGFRSGMSLILNEALSRDAHEVGSRIATLKQLREGKQNQALEGLEAGLNDTLITFDPAQPYPGLKEQTVVALRKAIDEAKE